MTSAPAGEPSWIWSEQHTQTSNDPRYVRAPFELPDDPAAAKLTITCDNSYEAFINGTSVAKGDAWEQPFNGPVAGLVKGKNVLAVKAVNDGGKAGLLFELTVTLKDKKTVRIVSDLSSRVGMKEEADWKLAGFTGNWPGVVNIAAWNAAPWNLQSFGSMAGTPAAALNDDPEDERRSFEVDPAFEVNLFAADPQIHKPIQMNFYTQGRLWLVSSSIYPQIKPGEVANDKVLILEDKNGDGTSDSTTVFADGLLIPTGIEPGDGGAYVANSTELIHLKDTNGDGKADTRSVLLSGFGTEDTHHIIHTFRWGPDGALYFNQSIYIHSHIETPRGTKRLGGGGLWRFRPASYDLDVFCKGMCNPWGTTWNDYGQIFGTDGAGSDGIHYLVQGFTYPHFPGGGKAFPGLNKGHPKYAGAEIVGGRHLPDDWQGDILTNDFRAHRVVRFKFSEDGSGYAVKQMPDLIKTKNVAFRPIDVKMGPDGAIYIADWYNPIINHGEVDFFDPRRDRTRGRIWRVSAKGRPLVERPKLAGATIPQLLELLKAPESYTRHYAKRELAARDSKGVLAALPAWIAAQKEPRHKLEGLWLHETLDAVNPALLAELLASPNADVRAAALRTVNHWQARLPNAQELLAKGTTDEHPRVRIEAVRNLAQIGTARAFDAATAVLDKPMDRFLDHALWLAANDLKNVWTADATLTFGGDDKRRAWALNAIGSQQAAQDAMKKLAAGTVPADQENAVLATITTSASPKDIGKLVELCATPNKFSDATAAKVLERAMRTCWEKTIIPEVNPQHFSAILDARKASVPCMDWTLRLIGRAAAEPLRAKVTELVQSETVQPAVRRSAIGALSDLAGPQSVTVLQTLAAPTAPWELRRWVAVATPTLDVKLASNLSAELLAVPPAETKAENYDAAVTELFNAFVRRSGLPESLATALAAKKPVPEAARIGLRAAQSAGLTDSPLAKALSAAAGDTGNDEKTAFSTDEMKQFVAAVQAKGDPTRGETVYRRAELQCMVCHAIGEAGGNIGPNLLSIGASAPVDYLIDSLYFPNSKVKEGYHAETVIAKDGRVITGVKLKENDGAVTLRDASGEEITIARDNIRRKRDAGSIMPANLMDTLKKDDVYDLVRFLSELGKPGPYAASSTPLARKWLTLDKAPADIAAADKVPAADWKLTWSQVDGNMPVKAGVPAAAKAQLDVTAPGTLIVKLNAASLLVDGTPVPIQNGAATFEAKPGTRTLTVIPVGAALRAELTGGTAKAQWLNAK